MLLSYQKKLQNLLGIGIITQMLVSQAHELMNEGQKLFVEIAEYGQRMGSNLSDVPEK